MSLFIKKDLDRLIADANDPKLAEGGHGVLQRHLTAWNLSMLGIGAIIGAGIFSLTGMAAANYAGPGIVFSFVIGGILCAFAGLCYAEMAAMVPVSGSAYAYSYATMGEFIAWIIGWDLILEYAFGAVTVSAAWSGYFISLVTKTLGVEIGDTLLRFTKGPWESVTLQGGVTVQGYWNAPATFIAIFTSWVLFRGIKESATMNNIIVFVKVFIILAFIAIGWGVIDSANWIANPEASGLSRLVPAVSTIERLGKPVETFGWPGVLTGAGVVFFAYIGFDAISTTAQEAKNPQRDLPIGILTSLVACTVMYILMSLTLTGVVNYKLLAVPDPIAVGVDQIVARRAWSPGTAKSISFFVKFGALAGLTSVILVMMLGQTRVFYAMAKDGLLPWFHRIHPKYGTPGTATKLTGAFVAFAGGLMPMALVGELVSIGTLLAFVLVCLSIPILRVKDPNRARPFRTPAYWFVSLGGAAACFWVMTGLPADTWIRLFVWLAIGFAIYFGYGIKHSRLRAGK